MRSVLLAIALIAGTAAQAEQPATGIKAGMPLFDANNARLGNITRINADGSVGVIVDSKFVKVAADTLSVVDGKPMTKLTRRELTSHR